MRIKGGIMNHRIVCLFLLVGLPAVGCQLTGGYNLPPAERLMQPGPGVGGPGPGVLMAPTLGVAQASYLTPDGGAAAAGAAGFASHDALAAGALVGPGAVPAGSPVQLLFLSPESMYVFWDVTGMGTFDSVPLVAPGRSTFQAGAIYRLKIANIPGPGREGVELYPTIEIAPPSYRSAAFLAHSAIPVQFTEEDLDQVLTGNFVTKVIYLPDPEFQELALAGVRTLVSTRLEPGVDPIVEADRRGAILAVIRMGNKDMETPDVVQGGVATASHHAPVPHASSAGGAPVTSAPRATTGGSELANPGGSHTHPYTGAVSHGAVDGTAVPVGPGGMPAGLVAGLAVPQYGMPITGTPIGLPGPPHVPLGTPAGLQKHVMHNWTHVHLPKPTEKLKINVKQRPGLSYPHPANRAWIVEDMVRPADAYSNAHFGTVPGGQEMVPAGRGLGSGLLGWLHGRGHQPGYAPHH